MPVAQTQIGCVMPANDENDIENKVLTLDVFHEIGGYAGSTPGTMLIARFRNAVNRGETPLLSDLELIANALEPLQTYYLNDVGATDNRLRDALDEFARRMKLKKKQGRGSSKSVKEVMPIINSIIRYFEKRDEFIFSGENGRSAASKALAWSSEKEGLSKRAMKDRIKEHAQFAEIEYDLRKKARHYLEAKSGK